jgi:penicillin-binding protein 1A
LATLPPERLASARLAASLLVPPRPDSARPGPSRPDSSRLDPRPLARPRRAQVQTASASAKRRRKLVGTFALVSLLVLAVITGSLAGLTLVYSFDLPQIADLEQYRASTTTDLYDQKGRVIGSFALERREVVGYDGFAPVLRQAVISIEDKSFESHWGINVFRVAGAVWYDIRSKGRAQGASTLTMQLARNLFLSSTRTPTRKIQEAYLAIQIERSFTKEQIFTLYGNQIYLGSGMYGFEAASEYFFSKHAKDLTLPEAALLAGLPKGPVAYSPILYPEKALRRRNLVLTEMEQDKVISPDEANEARLSPLGLHLAQPETSVAPWFQEEVRRELEKRFGTEQVHEAGLKVQTTLDLDLQQTANRAVEDGLAAYERRHGWNTSGKLENVVAQGSTLEDYRHPDWALKSHPGDYVHALVTSVLPLEIRARIGPPSQDPAHPDPEHQDQDEVVLLPNDWQWTGAHHGDDLVKPGDIIYIHLADTMEGSGRRATLEQDSGAQGALMAMDNTTGDVLAMVGGRDYALSQFNRATQAERQTGSSFKPYVYATAIEDGAKPTDIIVDGPVSFGSYTPHNYEGDYKGAMTLTSAFAESRNIPALKLAARVGIHKVIDMTHRFGVTSNIPAYLPVAIGAVEISLQEQLASYAVFPNDGLRVTPRLIRKVSNADGITLWEDNPQVTEVIDQHTARTMMILLQAVTQHGTGAAAAQLNHPLGGKTGTTSDYTDAWFLGFSPSITCGVWVGYDDRQSLGDKETGAKAALPIWMAVMRQAIVGKDDEKFLGDQDGEPAQRSTPMLQAALHTHAVSEPARAPAKPKLLANVSAPTQAAVSPAKHTTAPAPNPATKVTVATLTSRPLVRPALIPQMSRAAVQGTVRPALQTARP